MYQIRELQNKWSKKWRTHSSIRLKKKKSYNYAQGYDKYIFLLGLSTELPVSIEVSVCLITAVPISNSSCLFRNMIQHSTPRPSPRQIHAPRTKGLLVCIWYQGNGSPSPKLANILDDSLLAFICEPIRLCSTKCLDYLPF